MCCVRGFIRIARPATFRLSLARVLPKQVSHPSSTQECNTAMLHHAGSCDSEIRFRASDIPSSRAFVILSFKLVVINIYAIPIPPSLVNKTAIEREHMSMCSLIAVLVRDLFHLYIRAFCCIVALMLSPCIVQKQSLLHVTMP